MRAYLIACVGVAIVGGAYWAASDREAGDDVPSPSLAASHRANPSHRSKPSQALTDAADVSETDASAIKDSPVRPLIQPRAMPAKRMNRPHGKGLAAWQEFYRNVPRFGGLVINSGAPEFAWWFEDPEMLALYQEEFEKSLPIVLLDIEERRARESDPTLGDPMKFDSGFRTLENNLERYGEEIEALGFQPDWFREQGLRSDEARRLASFLVQQARAAQSGKQFDFEGTPRYRFNTPLDQVVARAAGLDMASMSPERASSLVDRYANTLLQAAEIRTQMQLYESAATHASGQLGFPGISPNVHGAPFSDEVLAYEADLAALWDGFILEVKGDE
jgi:hypothetical protein